MSAMLENITPASSNTGHAISSFGLWLMPSASITPMIAVTVKNALNAAQSISASTTSSRPTGAFMMPSQVFCTCMRENAE